MRAVLPILLLFVAASNGFGAERIPVTLTWVCSPVEWSCCDSTNLRPHTDGATTVVEISKNFGPWIPPFFATRMWASGQTVTQKINVTNGLTKIRVVPYDDAGNRGLVCQEVWIVVMMNRVLAKWVNET